MKKIGRYEIRERLGKGSMGAVYKVTIPVIRKIAALKCLDPGPKLVENMGMDRLRRQFVREASLIANIRHPNVVDIWSLEEEEGRLFYLMEYFCHNLGVLIGESYWADAPSRPVQAEKAVRIILETLKGLFRLHQSGIIHRDIKPFNILLTDAGEVKITDFGLSKQRGERSAAGEGEFIGTKYYAAPEQVEDPGSADHRADLYSVGIMLHRMLTGQLPGASTENTALLNLHLSDEWTAFINKAIAPEPGSRFQDARQMSDALEHLHEAYQISKARECRLAEDTETTQAETPAPVREKNGLRSEAGRITAARAAAAFDLNDLGRPNTYIQNKLETTGGGTVIDRATGLVWQQSGSGHSMPLKEAMAYIEELNRMAFGGYGRWRMPTINELLSLLNPPPPGEDFCFESPFSSTQKWIWSGDSRSIKASWVVNVEMGFVTSSDVIDFFYVKGVCSL